MGCCGEREKGPPEYTAKWEYLTLADFKATSTWATFAYLWLWCMAIVAVAVYVLDTYTAINLLAFDRWSSQIKPEVPFTYSKWIFAACIMLSWALCFYEWFRAIRVIKRGGVAESYMDPLAVTLLSMKPKGWRRFLVFTSLTKSKKGADYIALFVYFAFKGAVRVVLAEGPRQAVNGMTLYAVLRADLVQNLKNNQRSAFEQFFVNIQTLAESNIKQALVISSMLFTFIVWVFSALSLIIAIVLYITFLWHYIPQSDGRLSVYCKRKIDRRLEKIVEHKVKAAIEDEARKKEKQERKAEKAAAYVQKKTGELPVLPPKLTRAPTLPQLGDSPMLSQDEKLPDVPISRQTSHASSSTVSKTESHQQPTLPDIGSDRPPLLRTATRSSAWTNGSYESDAPLLANAGYAGGGALPPLPRPAYSRDGSVAPSGPGGLGRTMTQSTQATDRSFTPGPNGMQRPFTPAGDTGIQRTFTPNGSSGFPGPPGMLRPLTPTGVPGIQRSFTPNGLPGPNGPPAMQRSFTPSGQSSRPFTPAGQPGMRRPFSPMNQAGEQRPFSPMSNNDFMSARPSQGPRGLPRSNTPKSVAGSQDLYGQPIDSPVPENTPGPREHGGATANSFSRPLPLATTSARQATSTQQSFSRPLRSPTSPHDAPQAAALYRPFTPASAVDQSAVSSYEMTSNPSYSSANVDNSSAVGSSYRAFKPSSSKPSTPTIEPESLIPIPSNNLMVPDTAHNRLTTGYSDIFDDYGSSSRISAIEIPSSGHISPRLTRSHSADPAASDAHWQHEN
ncbi:Hypothetical protein R9X50_00132100 [Acrodontium crateriforme]|uniref:Vacuolar membrane protein n=1 Tax=Acrodontium crateriforme TaxID=150365 RepID=A0AAQ3R7T5_9PEZI|nr:Hypothetical protein R9X50_00132100 [Acrodontium crateriforme]